MGQETVSIDLYFLGQKLSAPDMVVGSPAFCSSWAELEHAQNIEKSPHYLHQFSQKSDFPPQTSKSGKTPPSTFKTIHLTSWPCYKQF